MAVLSDELRWPRPLRTPFATYSELTAKELDVLEAAAVAVDRLGAGAIPHYVISGAESASDVLEVALLLREVGPGAADADAAERDGHRAAVRDHRRPAPRARGAGHAPRPPAVLPARRRARRAPGGDDRLLRLEQGRRLPDRQLGAVPGPGGAGRRGRVARRAAAAVPRSRRHRRAGRRPGLRGDPGPAAGVRRRPAADHRAGRDGGRQVRPAVVGPAQPGDPRGRDPGGVGRARRPPRPRDRAVRRHDDASWPSGPTPPTARSSTRSPRSPGSTPRSPRSGRSRRSTSAAGRRRARARDGSRTCGRSRGCSAGRSAG